MNSYLRKKEIIFFNPGIKGKVFAHAANTFITVRELLHVQEQLVQKTNQPVVYIEDRRLKKR